MVLERDGYHKMRIVDVTREAGVAQGLFYHYFNDLKTLTVEVLTEFAEAARDPAEIEKDVEPRRLVQSNSRLQPGDCSQLCQASRRNALFCCSWLTKDPDFGSMLRNNYREQLMWLVERMPGLFPDVKFKKNQALMVVYSLAGVGEGLIREYFINRSEPLMAANLSVDQFAELMSTMFYRALFLEHPEQNQLKIHTQSGRDGQETLRQ